MGVEKLVVADVEMGVDEVVDEVVVVEEVLVVEEVVVVEEIVVVDASACTLAIGIPSQLTGVDEVRIVVVTGPTESPITVANMNAWPLVIVVPHQSCPWSRPC